MFHFPIFSFFLFFCLVPFFCFSFSLFFFFIFSVVRADAKIGKNRQEVKRNLSTKKSFRFLRVEAAWAGERNDPFVARAKDSSTLVFRLDLGNFDCLLGGRDDWFLGWDTPGTSMTLPKHWVRSRVFVHVLDRVSTNTFTICSRVRCCTRPFNGWICCSRAAARPARVLPEFVQSAFSSIEGG